jgi:hypothetical protein
MSTHSNSRVIIATACHPPGDSQVSRTSSFKLLEGEDRRNARRRRQGTVSGVSVVSRFGAIGKNGSAVADRGVVSVSNTDRVLCSLKFTSGCALVGYDAVQSADKYLRFERSFSAEDGGSILVPTYQSKRRHIPQHCL